MKKTIYSLGVVVSFLASSFALASGLWEKTNCTGTTKSGTVASFRIFHDPILLATRGQVKTLVLVKMQKKGSSQSIEFAISPDQLPDMASQGTYLVDGNDFNLMYTLDGAISGSYRWNAGEKLELQCQNIAGKPSVADDLNSFIKSIKKL